MISVTDDYVKKEKFTLQQDMKTQKDSKDITIFLQFRRYIRWGGTRYPLHRRLDRLQGLFGQLQKISPDLDLLKYLKQKLI